MNISYSYGIMDLFHYGHLKALKAAATGSDLHVVGLVSDEAAKSWMGAVVSTEAERRSVLESIELVDWVMPQKTLDPTDNLKKLHYIYPEAKITLFRGDDISVLSAREYLSSIGGAVQTLDYYEQLSPLQIVKALTCRSELLDKQCAVISTKANTLAALKERLTLSRIEDMYIAHIKDIKEHPYDIAERIRSQFAGSKIVVRSSSLAEDGFDSSNAGHFESVLNIVPEDSAQVIDALKKVYTSYYKDRIPDDDEQVLIQRQTEHVKYSGVVFTRDIQQNRPYYVINYDDSGSTDSVTSGAGGKSLYIAQDVQIETLPNEWKNLWRSIKELESILSKMLLDIEFAITQTDEVVIFQVRPFAASYAFGRVSNATEFLEIKNVQKEIYEKTVAQSGNSILSDMAFWNPAEIIGAYPHRLDYSLYRMIITHSAWNSGLTDMGYRKVDGDLMCQYGNKPYIIVERAFLSLIPNCLTEDIAQKLKTFYCSKLKKDVSAHDKIEFEIVFSCFDFCTKKELSALEKDGFSSQEISSLYSALYELTVTAIQNYERVLESDKADLAKLEEKTIFAQKTYTSLETIQSLSKLIFDLLQAITVFGTPQFARQARYAFIARSLAESLKKAGYWKNADFDAFMSHIHTVAQDFESAINDVQNHKMSKTDFDKQFGHLRAGTYNINQPRYDRQKDAFFANGIFQSERETPFSQNEDVSAMVDLEKTCQNALDSYSIPIAAKALLRFMKTALEMREYFKFEFTKTLSFSLELIAELASRLGFSRNDISFFDISEIASFYLYGTEEDMKRYIVELLPLRKKEYVLYSKLLLPSVITKPSDFDVIHIEESRPNFITTKTVSAPIIFLGNAESASVSGKIVALEKADPGYDWIFAKGIKGLVTRYGGVASHMAIRCAEFSLPAAIGCGQKIFDFVCKQNAIELDCKNGKIRSTVL